MGLWRRYSKESGLWMIMFSRIDFCLFVNCEGDVGFHLFQSKSTAPRIILKFD